MNAQSICWLPRVLISESLGAHLEQPKRVSGAIIMIVVDYCYGSVSDSDGETLRLILAHERYLYLSKGANANSGVTFALESLNLGRHSLMEGQFSRTSARNRNSAAKLKKRFKLSSVA